MEHRLWNIFLQYCPWDRSDYTTWNSVNGGQRQWSVGIYLILYPSWKNTSTRDMQTRYWMERAPPFWTKAKMGSMAPGLVQIQRRFIPDNIGPIEKKKKELHHFSYASNTGCGQCFIIRIVAERKVHCTLVMDKARVAPTKVVTGPRLELVAATVSAVVSNFLKEKFNLKVDQEFFSSESRVVLGIYKKWPPAIPCFVANHVQKIRNSTDPGQWFYVETGQNPADYVSSGLMMVELIKSNWFTGPKFLWDQKLLTIQGCPEFFIGYLEVRVLKTILTQRENVLNRLSRLSDWNRTLNIIARIKHMINKSQSGDITVTKRESVVERETLEEEFKLLNRNPNKLPKTSEIYQLDPILKDRQLRVGGRLKEFTSLKNWNPIIRPKRA